MREGIVALVREVTEHGACWGRRCAPTPTCTGPRPPQSQPLSWISPDTGASSFPNVCKTASHLQIAHHAARRDSGDGGILSMETWFASISAQTHGDRSPLPRSPRINAHTPGIGVPRGVVRHVNARSNP